MKQNKTYIMDTITGPWETIFKNFPFFLPLTVMFSFVLLCLAYLFGQTVLCLNWQESTCSISVLQYAFYLVLRLMIISVVVFIWCDKVYQGKKIDEKYIYANVWNYLRVFVVLCGIIILNLIPLLSIYLLLRSVPNPNWVIEALYFVIVSLGFWIPLVLMRFYALMPDLILGKGWKNLPEVWQKGQGKGLRIVLVTSLLFLLCVMLFSGVWGMLRRENFSSEAVYELVGEFCFDFLSIFVILLFINFFWTLRDYLLQKNTNI